MSQSSEGRIKNKELSNFYGLPQNEDLEILDINSKKFNYKKYVQKVLKEKPLKLLLEEETSLVNEIQRLDSDCQTLVYDHYDKFITATDIVKQMKEGSTKMSAQVCKLQENMAKITESSENITKDLQERRDHMSHLLGIDSTLKKLQFIFQLPQEIQKCIQDKNFAEGVRYYTETAEVLQKYQHLPSFSAIHTDCKLALQALNAALKLQLADKEEPAENLTLCVDLLLQLGEPAEGLCDDFLIGAGEKLRKDLSHITSLAHAPQDQEENVDILQFIDICHETFITDLWLIISSYKEMFIRSNSKSKDNMASDKLCTFVTLLVDEYVAVVGLRISSENLDSKEYSTLALALDKFHRRLHAINTLLPDAEFSRQSLELIVSAAVDRCDSALNQLKDNFTKSLNETRQSLSSPRQLSQDNSMSAQLNELLTRVVSSLAKDIKDKVALLLAFMETKHTFATRGDFSRHFSRSLVREGVVVRFFYYINESVKEFNCKIDKGEPALLLLLSRMCLDLQTSTIHYLLNHCDNILQIDEKRGLTELNAITSAMKETGQNLLNYYVTSQGTTISQMLRRSVELKDWLHCSEPRSVRRVMKTVRDEIAAMDSQVGALYEEGLKKERSSDSSRRTYRSISASRTGGRTWSSSLDNTLVANLKKLWSERIEIFAPVQFTRISILTGIIKISLKTLLECIRLGTYGRFGYQQVQVDIHYLRTYLWSYVSDEEILNVLLDEILTCVSLRCIDLQPMEVKIIEFICEQN